MSLNPTQSERLARIETLLEEKVILELASLRREVISLKKSHQRDVDELTGLKHKGAGILIGVSFMATAIGVTAASFWKQFLALFH